MLTKSVISAALVATMALTVSACSSGENGDSDHEVRRRANQTEAGAGKAGPEYPAGKHTFLFATPEWTGFSTGTATGSDLSVISADGTKGFSYGGPGSEWFIQDAAVIDGYVYFHETSDKVSNSDGTMRSRMIAMDLHSGSTELISNEADHPVVVNDKLLVLRGQPNGGDCIAVVEDRKYLSNLHCEETGGISSLFVTNSGVSFAVTGDTKDDSKTCSQIKRMEFTGAAPGDVKPAATSGCVMYGAATADGAAWSTPIATTEDGGDYTDTAIYGVVGDKQPKKLGDAANQHQRITACGDQLIWEQTDGGTLDKVYGWKPGTQRVGDHEELFNAAAAEAGSPVDLEGCAGDGNVIASATAGDRTTFYSTKDVAWPPADAFDKLVPSKRLPDAAGA